MNKNKILEFNFGPFGTVTAMSDGLFADDGSWIPDALDALKDILTTNGLNVSGNKKPFDKVLVADSDNDTGGFREVKGHEAEKLINDFLKEMNAGCCGQESPCCETSSLCNDHEESKPMVLNDEQKKDWEFWKSVILDKNGQLDYNQIQRELLDYSMVLDRVSYTYCELTDSKISKPHTDPIHVIQANEDMHKESVRDSVKEEIEALYEEGEISENQMKIILERFKNF